MPKAYGYLLDSNGNYDTKYEFTDTPENIALFIMNFSNSKIITDCADQLLVKTNGEFLAYCDSYLMSDLRKWLLPMQYGEVRVKKMIFKKSDSIYKHTRNV